MRYKNLVFCCSLVTMINAACTQSSSDDAATSTDTTATTTKSDTTTTTSKSEIEAAITNKLAESVPSALALAIFPQDDSSASLALAEDDEEVTDPNAKKSFADKVKENKKRLEGSDDEDCIRLNVFKKHKAGETETCYEFDSDMNPSKFADQPSTFGTKNGKNSSGEACMVAFARGEISDSVEAIDQAMEAISGVVCQAKKAKVDKKLGEGESIDLVESLADVGGGKMKFTEAKLGRIDNAEDGSSIYRNDIAFTDPRGRTVEIHLLHSPSSTGEKGTIWVKLSGEKAESAPAGGAPQPGAQQPAPSMSLSTDPNNSANKNFVTSIAYAKETDSDGKPSLSFEMRRAAIVNTVEPFTDEGLVNYAGLSESAQNSEVHAIKYVAYQGNPETGEGNLSYWMNPGGSLNESARGFLFNVTADDDGKLAGCGTSGATANVSIRKALVSPSSDNVLKPVRYWHPRENQNISPDKDARFTANEGFKITQQCFSFDNEANIYAIDTTQTTSEQGYDLLETAAVKVAPPAAPKKRFEGDVVNKKIED